MNGAAHATRLREQRAGWRGTQVPGRRGVAGAGRRASWWGAAALAILAGIVVLIALPGLAHAGSYLDRAALLLDGSKRDSDMLRARLTDKELAAVVQAIADTRVRAASRMEVPSAIAKAHPHLLLALEHAERAAQAAVDGSIKLAFEKLEAARRENEAFRALCREMNLALPKEGSPSPRAPSR